MNACDSFIASYSEWPVAGGQKVSDRDADDVTVFALHSETPNYVTPGNSRLLACFSFVTTLATASLAHPHPFISYFSAALFFPPKI